MEFKTSGDTLPATPSALPRNRFRRILKVAGFCLAALIALGCIAPFVSVGAYRGQIQSSLEASLGRHVDIGEVHFTLFAGPGFSLDRVTIYEDPLFGIEPAAYVPTLVAQLRINKLLAGHIQIARLRLVEPTLNVVKRNEGSWNVLPVLDRLGRRTASTPSFLPAVELSDARLNFKFGNRKSTFFIENANIAAYPELSGKLRIRFSGSPSRSDRSGIGFGTVRGTANWYVRAAANGNQVEASLTLEQTNVSEIATLVEGYDIGIHGNITAHASVSGPPTALEVRGDLRLEDIHRWDLVPASGEEWQVRYQGAIDLLHRQMSFETLPVPAGAATPVGLQVRVNDFVAAPAWSVIAQLRGAPIEKLLPLAQRLGLTLPDGLRVSGTVDGAVGYSNRSGWKGGLALTDAKAALPDGPPASAARATLSISDQRVHVFPSDISSAAGPHVEISGDYLPATRQASFTLAIASSPVRPLTKALFSWFGLPPFLPELRDGLVSGRLRVLQDATTLPEWSGDLELERAALQPPGIAAPVRDLKARISLSGAQMNVPRFSALVGAVPVSGDYRYNPQALRREHLTLNLPRIDLADLDKILAPSGGPRDFFSRFRFGRRSLPPWLAARDLEADAAIAHLLVNGQDVGALKTKWLWNGPRVDIADLRLTLPEGQLSAQATMDLSDRAPHLSLVGSLTSLPFKEGTLDISGMLETSGTGQDALANLRSTGSFAARDVSPAADLSFVRLAGNYTLSLEPGWPNVQLTDVQAEQDDDSWVGSGGSDQEGNLVLQLSNGKTQLRVSTQLAPLHPASVATTGH